jgi:peptidoglycan hydrolase-like protein with peptidoglycan-binding domain
MQLQDRRLLLDMVPRIRPDVDLLHAELARLGGEFARLVASNTDGRSRFFGEATAAAVRLFQERQGLRTTGIVDEETARRINEAVDRLPRSFVVRGRVVDQDRLPIPMVVVAAFDRDIGAARQRLGNPGRLDFTDHAGVFEIPYKSAQFAAENKWVSIYCFV